MKPSLIATVNVAVANGTIANVTIANVATFYVTQYVNYKLNASLN